MRHCVTTRQSPQKLRYDRSLAAEAEPSGVEPGSEPVEHSAWNCIHRGILCGAGVASEAEMSFTKPELEPLKIFPVSHPAMDTELESESQHCPGTESDLPLHLTQGRSLDAADTSPDSKVGVWAGITQNS